MGDLLDDRVDATDTQRRLEKMITRLIVGHYKSISELDLPLRPLNIIVGPNGAGKSNIVDALYFLHDCASEDLDAAILKRHGIESIRQWSKTRPFNISIEVYVKNEQQHGFYKVVLASARGTFRVLEEVGHWYGPNFISRDKDRPSKFGYTRFNRDKSGNVITNTDFNEDSNKSRLVKLSNTELFITLLGGAAFSFESLYLKSLASELQSLVSYSIYPNTLREPHVVSRQDQLLSDGSNLASIIRQINSGHKKNKELLVDALRLLMPSVTDILVKSAGGYYVPVLSVSEFAGSHQFNMSQVSDGTLRVLGLLAAFYQPHAPNVIALEEPEQMIHPGALPIIAEASREFVSVGNNRQIILTTHSPPLLDLFEASDIIWTTFSSGKSRAGHINDRQLSIIRDNLFTPGEVLVSEGFLEQ